MDAQQLHAIISAARKGDSEGYRGLLDHYGPRLYGYFLRATGRHHEAEDLLSELVLRLVRTLGDYDERGRFEPWLFRIAANMVRDRIRRRKASPQRVSLSTESESGDSLTDHLAGDSEPADGALLADETSLELHEAMGRLDETTRQMILLRHFAEMSFKEIAEWFDCPIGTALAKVHRGLKALRQIMKSP